MIFLINVIVHTLYGRRYPPYSGARNFCWRSFDLFTLSNSQKLEIAESALPSPIHEITRDLWDICHINLISSWIACSFNSYTPLYNYTARFLKSILMFHAFHRTTLKRFIEPSCIKEWDLDYSISLIWSLGWKTFLIHLYTIFFSWCMV